MLHEKDVILNFSEPGGEGDDRRSEESVHLGKRYRNAQPFSLD
jgi:hypothetical protein